ncbi:MAG: biotin--[acetyl-CoA-carboxylase] ligase [Thermodesulfovibrionales bacterium]|nr:biotin--[acetyl-CoA-carboxylase] ligase [Thermodesulfovibrionales bacterium]
MLKNDLIIEMLSRNEGYLSGSKIAEVMGVSRAAIWKRIKILKAKGYKIEGSITKGYKLIELPNLSIETIRTALKREPLKIGKELIFYDTVSSTNIVAGEFAARGYGEGIVVIADEQTAGKGRLGRKWISPKGKNLYLSSILTPPILPKDTPILTLLAGVACCTVLKEYLGLPATIKWPNDLLLEDKKVGGILSEIKADIDRVIYAIVGIGININSDVEDFPEELREVATSIKIHTKKEFSRTEVVILLLKELQKWYDILLTKGKEEILSKWQRLSSTIGKKVKAQVWNNVFIGVAESIDDDGFLILRLNDNSSIRINAGDITMLRDGELY